MINILVVGQTPPPFGGQAVMINYLVHGKYEKIRIIHLRLSYSHSMSTIGKFKPRKLMHLLSTIFYTIKLKFQCGITVLYYPPAGPNLVPVIRDIVYLSIVRPFFKTTIFHFRAAGVSDFLEKRGGLLRTAARFAYRTPDAAIQLSALNPQDGTYFNAKRIYVVPNGLEDSALQYQPILRRDTATPCILYIGVLSESKGIRVLVEALAAIKQRHVGFTARLMGEFASAAFEKDIRNIVRDNDLIQLVDFIGVKTGNNKSEELRNADLFCFPTHFESESFGNVVVEAMMFSLPVVATRWRGVPDIVTENESGFLISVKDPRSLANKLTQLLESFELRKQMGEAGRKRYTDQFTLERHLHRMEEVLYDASHGEHTSGITHSVAV